MAYAVIADVEKRLPVETLRQLAGNPPPAQGSAEYNAALNEELAHASSVIDSYAGAKYALPLQPAIRITMLTVDIAAYELEKNRNVVRESERDAYKDAIRFLEQLAAGKATLDQPAGEDPQAAGGGTVKRDDREHIFSKGHLGDF